MNQHRPSILEGIDEMRRQLGEVLSRVLPDELSASAAPRIDEVVTSLMEQFQLVPRDEFDRYLALLDQLNQRVESLGERVSDLEAPVRQTDLNLDV